MNEFYQRMYRELDGIFNRLYKINLDKKLCIDNAASVLNDGAGLGIDFVCQYILADDEDDQWLDIALSDLILMMKMGKHLRANYQISDFEFLVEETPHFEQMYDRKYGIADIIERMRAMNPSKEGCINEAKAANELGDTKFAVDTLCRFISAENVRLDVMLSDFLSLLKIGKQVDYSYSWGSFASLFESSMSA